MSDLRNEWLDMIDRDLKAMIDGSDHMDPCHLARVAIAELRAAVELLTRERDEAQRAIDAARLLLVPGYEATIARATAAEADAAAAREQVRKLRKALTPSAETKHAYIGEFWFYAETRADEDGETLTQRVMVPWATIKEIMAAIATRAALQGEGER